ncbi:MAG: RNA polymerase factor sigma-54 [Paludibacteraceae bacterium]|nr:RNA polymerase factor sigma-54 [Paludibacteraceae bacterium]
MQTLNLTQDLKLQQKLSPAQIQVVRLLELPSCELSARVNEELQENPALEEGADPLDNEASLSAKDEDFGDENTDDYRNPLQNEDFDYDQYIQDDEMPEYRYQNATSGGDDDTRDIPFSVGISFGEYLKSQVYLTKMDKPQRHIAKFIVGNIDEDGYLRRTAEELCDDLYFREGLTVSDNEMRDMVRQVQAFDPPGVGAKDLKECLLIQLEQKSETPAVCLAKRMLTQYFEDFSKRHFDHIQDRLDITSVELKDAIAEITKLNPKPGSAWQGTIYDRHQTVVIPDFFVENQDGKLILTLNTGDIPSLHVSREYRDMLEDYSASEKNRSGEQKDAIRFVKQKLDAAQWFIDAIKQRNETLQRTMNAIIKMQRDWFMEGDETYLKPMVLQDIANMTGYDVSTISRVSNSKYVQTEYGVFPLKFFFSEKMVNAEGEEISTREIKKILTECVAAEDKQNPLTDDALVEALKQKGYTIARRTVAKYREQLGLPVARMRRQI